MKRTLIVFYSWSNGNTKRIADLLQEKTGADMARIETEQPYSGSYEEVVAQGKKEAESGFMPEIQPLGADASRYEVVAVGTPTWWYTMAPAVRSFLHSVDWEGKTVIPFMTNGGWPGHVIKDMKVVCADAEVQLAKEIQFDSDGGDRLVTTQEEIDEWIGQVAKLCAD